MPAIDAADLVQEVFVVLVRKLPEFTADKDRSFRGWLRTLLVNRWRDLRRRRPPPAPVNPDQLREMPDPTPGAELEEREFRRHLVQRALQVMRRDFQPATWQACWQTKVEGRPAAQVAADLGLSVAAVHAATYRVLRRLRQELAGFVE